MDWLYEDVADEFEEAQELEVDHLVAQHLLERSFDWSPAPGYTPSEAEASLARRAREALAAWTVACECGAPMVGTSVIERGRRYCSTTCRVRAYRRRHASPKPPCRTACVVCETPFHTTVAARLYCSPACTQRARRCRDNGQPLSPSRPSKPPPVPARGTVVGGKRYDWQTGRWTTAASYDWQTGQVT